MISIKAIIPAAGYATRLYPLTKDAPKALLDIMGKPILEYIIQKILELDVDEIFIVTNAKFYPNFMEWKKGFSCRVHVNIIDDGTSTNENRLGQIGDIIFVLEKAKIDQDILIIAGDNLFNFSLKPIYTFFKKRQLVVNALYDVKSVELAKQLGVGKLGKDNHIVEFREKDPDTDSTLCSTGIYFLPRQGVKFLFDYINGGNPPDKMGYFMMWLIKNHELLGFVYNEKWFDIGCHEALEQTKKEFTP